jgi:hypothetical protein
MRHGNNLYFSVGLTKDHDVGEATETLGSGAVEIERTLLRGCYDLRHDLVQLGHESIGGLVVSSRVPPTSGSGFRNRLRMKLKVRWIHRCHPGSVGVPPTREWL